MFCRNLAKRLSELQGMFIVCVKFVKISEQKFESQLTVMNPCISSLIKHAVSANQSARYMETFFNL